MTCGDIHFQEPRKELDIMTNLDVSPGMQGQSDISGPNNAIEHINNVSKEIHVYRPTDAETSRYKVLCQARNRGEYLQFREK